MAAAFVFLIVEAVEGGSAFGGLLFDLVGFLDERHFSDALAEQARDAFAKYLKSVPDGDYALEANVGLARLAADRGDRALDAANKKGIAPDEADSKRLAARDAYSEAKPYLSAALKIAQAPLM